MTAHQYGLLSSSVLYGLGGAAQRLLGFLLLPLFTRYLTPADYGIVGLLVALPGLLLPIFSLGLSASIGVCYFGTANPADRLSVIQTSRWISYASAIALTSFTLIALDWVTLLSVNNPDYRIHTLVAIIAVSLSLVCLPLQLEQQFAGRPLEFVLMSFVGAVFTSLCSVVCIVFLDLGALGMLLGNLLGQALVMILLLGWRKSDRGGTVSLCIAKDLVLHGLPMLPSFALLFIMQYGVRWPLERAHGVDAVGLYSLGASFGASLSLFTSGLVAAWLPWAMGFSNRWEEGRHVLAQRITQYLIGGGFMVFLFFCVAQPALMVLAPTSYFDAWQVIGMAAAAGFMMSLFSLVLPPIYIAKKVYLVLVSQGVAALVTVIAIYFLLHLGIIGSALAVLIGSITLVAVQLFVNSRMTTLRSIPFASGRLVQIVVVLGLACWATFRLSLTDIWFFILQSLFLTLFTGLVMLRYFPDKHSLLRIFR